MSNELYSFCYPNQDWWYWVPLKHRQSQVMCESIPLAKMRLLLGPNPKHNRLYWYLLIRWWVQLRVLLFLSWCWFLFMIVFQGIIFDPETGATLHVELARSNSRAKRPWGCTCHILVFCLSLITAIWNHCISRSFWQAITFCQQLLCWSSVYFFVLVQRANNVGFLYRYCSLCNNW